jgi:hypothetical protein
LHHLTKLALISVLGEEAKPDRFIVISERTAADKARGYFGVQPGHPE